jgi:hypothetical protein
MKLAQIAVLDEAGRPVWDGSLLDFLHANCYSADYAREIIEQLRPIEGERPEIVTLGGGAAPVFYLSLVA